MKPGKRSSEFSQPIGRVATKAETAGFWGLIVLLGTQPFILLPGLNAPYTLPKAVALQVGVAILLSVWLGHLLLFGGSIRRGGLDFLVLLLVAGTVAATVLSISWPVSLFGGYGRYRGLLTTISLAAVYWLAVQVTWEPRRLTRLALALAGSGLLMSLYGLIQYLGYEPLPFALKHFEAARSSATVGNPSILSAYLVLTLPFALVLATVGESRWLRQAGWVSALGISLATVMTFARGGWLALLVVLALAGWNLSRLRLVDRRAVVGLVMALVLGLGLLVLAGPRQSGVTNLAERAASLLNPSAGSAGSRLEIWKTALRAWERRPLFGWGPDTLRFVMPRYQSLRLARIRAPSDDAHNWLLQQLATTGVIGTAPLLALLLIFFARLFALSGKQADAGGKLLVQAVGLSAAAYLLAASFTVTATESLLPLWLFMGIASASTSGWQARVKAISSTGLRAVVVATLVAANVVIMARALQPLTADRAFSRGDYQRAVALNPVEPLYSETLAAEYARQLIASGARTSFSLGLKTLAAERRYNPWSAGSYNLEAVLYYQASTRLGLGPRGVTLAIQALRQQLRLDPYAGDAHFRLANLYLETRRYQEAETELRRALPVIQDSAPIWAALGYSLDRQGKKRQAVMAYRRTLRLRPGWQPVQTELKRLKGE